MQIDLTRSEAQALVELIWAQMDPGTQYTAPDAEALRTLNNKVVEAFAL